VSEQVEEEDSRARGIGFCNQKIQARILAEQTLPSSLLFSL